jgi:23S rRNA pseudouridine1911/1915/1917 synthase
VWKRYQALTEGIPTERSAKIDAPITRHHADRTRMTVRPDGKASETDYEIVRTIGNRALLDVHPKTGRTHQIRVHLAALGTPIVGDAIYGTADPTLNRPFLHAAGLELLHPTTGEPLRFESPLPPELEKFLESHE